MAGTVIPPYRGILDLVDGKNAANSIGVFTSPDGEDQDVRRRLEIGVYWSASFCVTYQFLLLAILGVFTLRHWGTRAWRRWISIKDRHRVLRSGHKWPEDVVEGAIANDNDNRVTSIGVSLSKQTKCDEVADESSPLIDAKSSTPPINGVRLFLRRMRAVAMYQPPPVPSISREVTPEITTLLACIAVYAINIFYTFYNIEWEWELTFTWSDRAARMFAANLPWLYIFGAKNQPIRMLTGYSYENLNIIHRRIGEILCLLALVHTVGMQIAWWFFFRPGGMDIWWWLTEKTIYLGYLALICYESLYFTSLASFREWCYELFLASHVFLQFAALILLYFHHRGGSLWALIALIIFLVDRVVYRIWLKTSHVKADLTVMQDNHTVMLSADWPTTRSRIPLFSKIFGHNTHQGWHSTEHVFISVPALGKSHLLQAHPFTIASGAPHADQQHAWFNLIIRAHHGFTQELLTYAQNHSTALVRLDGPYGAFHALDKIKYSDIGILIVGGSGIAVGYPLLWSLVNRPSSENDTESQSHPRARRKPKLGLIWVIHESSHISWLGQERLDELQELGVSVCVPPATSKAGRPDMAALTRRMVHDLSIERASEDGRRRTRRGDAEVGVVVSGPDGMNRDVRNTCATMAWEGWDVSFGVEKYGW